MPSAKAEAKKKAAAKTAPLKGVKKTTKTKAAPKKKAVKKVVAKKPKAAKPSGAKPKSAPKKKVSLTESNKSWQISNNCHFSDPEGRKEEVISYNKPSVNIPLETIRLMKKYKNIVKYFIVFIE